MRRHTAITAITATLLLAACAPTAPHSSKPRTHRTTTVPAAAPTKAGAEQATIRLTAVRATFAPSVLADGSAYTSVKVTITNTGADELSVNPLYFTVTDSTGEKQPAQLAVDENQIATLKLAKGEKATGTITVKGKVAPVKVTFTDGLIGDSVSASVS